MSSESEKENNQELDFAPAREYASGMWHEPRRKEVTPGEKEAL